MRSERGVERGEAEREKGWVGFVTTQPSLSLCLFPLSSSLAPHYHDGKEIITTAKNLSWRRKTLPKSGNVEQQPKQTPKKAQTMICTTMARPAGPPNPILAANHGLLGFFGFLGLLFKIARF